MILSKVSFFYVKVSWWGCFKDFSSLLDLCLAGYLDDLLDDVTGLVSFCLVPESDESLDDVYKESFEDNEDEESDEISI